MRGGVAKKFGLPHWVGMASQTFCYTTSHLAFWRLPHLQARLSKEIVDNWAMNAVIDHLLEKLAKGHVFGSMEDVDEFPYSHRYRSWVYRNGEPPPHVFVNLVRTCKDRSRI